MVDYEGQANANIIASAITALKNATVAKSYAEADTNGVPTKAQLTSAFGAPATVGAGFRGVFKDIHTGAVAAYLVGCDGTDYFAVAVTKSA